MTAPSPKVVVIGAGIVGASIAYHLARRGARVLLLDAATPGAGVTAQAFGWINVSFGVAGPNAGLRGLAIAEYHRLDRELGGALGIAWTGALTWSRDTAATERMVRDHIARGHDIRLLDRGEVAALEPGLRDLPDCAAYAVGEGAIDGAGAARIMVRAARDAGAELRADAPVAALVEAGGRVAGVRIADATIAADIVVLAAGTGTAALCREAGIEIPIRMSPAIRMRFTAPGKLVGRILSTPGFEIRQAGDGALLAAESYIDDSPENGPPAVAQRTLAAIRGGLRGADGLMLDDIVVGRRPIPADDQPIIGQAIEGLYLAVMHAGVTLAPVVGRLATAEILDQVAVAALSPCRPGRFAGRAPDHASAPADPSFAAIPPDARHTPPRP